MTLQVERVSFGYDPADAPIDETTRSFSLADVSLTIRRGSLTGLLGPNGCGKTTLLKLMAGVMRPRAGAITLGGRAIHSIPRRELARQIAVVPQETHPCLRLQRP